jgi:hypothetical protein
MVWGGLRSQEFRSSTAADVVSWSADSSYIAPADRIASLCLGV